MIRPRAVEALNKQQDRLAGLLRLIDDGRWWTGDDACLIDEDEVCLQADRIGAALDVVERAATGFRRLQPQFCSIYEPYFWWHERFWKLSTQPGVFNGTPFKAIAWRLLGVPVGRRASPPARRTTPLRAG